jgi:nucleoside recognition membrane protein YjiH
MSQLHDGAITDCGQRDVPPCRRENSYNASGVDVTRDILKNGHAAPLARKSWFESVELAGRQTTMCRTQIKTTEKNYAIHDANDSQCLQRQ